MPKVDGLYYGLCPRCGRAVPVSADERYCVNDGCRMLRRCPKCGAKFTSPYSQFCSRCGLKLGGQAAPLKGHTGQGNTGNGPPRKENPE